MSDDQNLNTAQPDAFEAALAASATDLATPQVEEVIEEVAAPVSSTVASTDSDVALTSDEDGDIESDENDPNAEFRRALRVAPGDWYVVHSYAGYEKKVKGNLQNRIQSLNMEDYIFQIEVPEEEIKHYYAELEREKKEHTEFWSQHGCSVTMAVLLAAANGEDLDIAQAKAKLVEKKKVITEDSIGEMPAYGTPEFWAWCRRRKELRLQKEAAIIAAGGTVLPQKVKGNGSKVQKKEAAP